MQKLIEPVHIGCGELDAGVQVRSWWLFSGIEAMTACIDRVRTGASTTRAVLATETHDCNYVCPLQAVRPVRVAMCMCVLAFWFIHIFWFEHLRLFGWSQQDEQPWGSPCAN